MAICTLMGDRTEGEPRTFHGDAKGMEEALQEIAGASQGNDEAPMCSQCVSSVENSSPLRVFQRSDAFGTVDVRVRVRWLPQGDPLIWD